MVDVVTETVRQLGIDRYVHFPFGLHLLDVFAIRASVELRVCSDMVYLADLGIRYVILR